MGFSNGLRTTISRSERGEKGARGEGLKLTEDDHFHLGNKRLTSVAAPVQDNDAVTKKYLTNTLKAKAGTTYVINELAKKANTSVLNNYVLKKDIPSGDALKDYALKTELNNFVSELLVLRAEIKKLKNKNSGEYELKERLSLNK